MNYTQYINFCICQKRQQKLSRTRTSVHVLQKWLLTHAEYGLTRRVYISSPHWKDERDPLALCIRETHKTTTWHVSRISGKGVRMYIKAWGFALLVLSHFF